MKVFLVLLIGLYIAMIVAFSFVSQPVFLCLLVFLSCISSCGMIYLLMGFSWYTVLVCIIYVGGVYVLLIFVTVYQPNTIVGSSVGGKWLIFFSVVGMLIYSWSIFAYWDIYVEYSHHLCNSYEGYSYLVLCIVLLLGFSLISVIANRKDSFYR